MAFNFSAMQYEPDFQAKRNCNWENPRFFPPLPRTLKLNSKPVADNNGHLLPTARREGHFLGNYRGTYHLPLRITRSFIALYNRCLSGHHRFLEYPQNHCCCHRERTLPCNCRDTLGDKRDPQWKRPVCQTKCEGLKQMLELSECKHVKCQPKFTEKLIPRMGDASSRYGKKLRKRPVTAFEFNRRANAVNEEAAADKGKARSVAKEAAKYSLKHSIKESDKESSMEPSKQPSRESAKKSSKETAASPAAHSVRSKSSTKHKAHHK